MYQSYNVISSESCFSASLKLYFNCILKLYVATLFCYAAMLTPNTSMHAIVCWIVLYYTKSNQCNLQQDYFYWWVMISFWLYLNYFQAIFSKRAVFEQTWFIILFFWHIKSLCWITPKIWLGQWINFKKGVNLIAYHHHYRPVNNTIVKLLIKSNEVHRSTCICTYLAMCFKFRVFISSSVC